MRDQFTGYLRRLTLVGAVLSMLVVVAAPAGAQPSSQTGDYSGAGRAAIVDLDVAQDEALGSLLGDSLVDAVLAPSRQAARTQNNLPDPPAGGVNQAVLGPGLNLFQGISGDNVAFGEGTNVETELAGQSLLSNILVEAIATAPPTSSDRDELLNLDNSLLRATAAEAEAFAQDVVTDACPDDGTVARGFSNVANAELLPTATGPLGGLLGGDTTGGLLGDLLGLGDLSGILPSLGGLLEDDGTLDPGLLDEGAPTGNLIGVGDTVASETLTQLINLDGQSTQAVRSISQADLTAISLLGGAVQAQVASPVRLTVTAGGTPGSAAVDFQGELINLGPTEVPLLGTGGLLEGDVLGDTLTDLGLTQVLISLDQPGVIQQETTADGTHAAAHASLLRVQVLASGELIPELGGAVLDDSALLSLDVAPLAAVANAPPGGVDCRPPDGNGGGPGDVVDVVKDGPQSTTPGETFNYTIDVSNDSDECSLEDVTVTDKITGPADSEVTTTDPEATLIQGAIGSGLNVIWQDAGPIAPGDTKRFTVTIRTGSTASTGQTFRDEVDVSATCDDRDVTGRDVIERPTVGAVPKKPTPVTGGGALAVAGMSLLLAAGVLARRRTR